MADKTSEQYIAPLRYRFCDPKDVQKDCDCTKTLLVYQCGEETNCEKAGGKCHVVLAGPRQPQLVMPMHEAAAGHETATVDLPPGWEAFCACLKYTGEDPTDPDIC